MNFDGLEILEMQMTDSSNSYLQQLKRRAHSNGLPLCGFSTHQGFVSPDSARRQDNIKKTIASIEQAYRLGIPTMRINTGRWGTIKSFDTLMENRGIEPRLEGYTDDDASKWVIQSIEECLPVAEKCGVVLGLENHWGLGRTAAGVLKIVDTIKSPWLQATLDTGNFLEDMYQQMEALAPAACFVQAKHITAAAPGTHLISTMNRLPQFFITQDMVVGCLLNSKVRMTLSSQSQKILSSYEMLLQDNSPLQ